MRVGTAVYGTTAVRLSADADTHRCAFAPQEVPPQGLQTMTSPPGPIPHGLDLSPLRTLRNQQRDSVIAFITGRLIILVISKSL